MKEMQCRQPTASLSGMSESQENLQGTKSEQLPAMCLDKPIRVHIPGGAGRNMWHDVRIWA